MKYPKELRESLGFYIVLHSNKKGNIAGTLIVLKYSMGEQMHRADTFKIYQLRPNLAVKICEEIYCNQNASCYRNPIAVFA